MRAGVTPVTTMAHANVRPVCLIANSLASRLLCPRPRLEVGETDCLGKNQEFVLMLAQVPLNVNGFGEYTQHNVTLSLHYKHSNKRK
jgi:hypothetical protein